MVLLVGAASLTRGTARATSLNPGFTMDGIQVVSVQVGPALGEEPARHQAFLFGLIGALETSDLGPIASSEQPPFSEVPFVMMARKPDESPGASHPILLRPVSRNYFYHTPSWRTGAIHLLVRSSSPAVADRVRAVAASLESGVTVTTRPLADYVRESMGTAVLASRSGWAIGLLGLVLAVAGAFGVFAHEVEERRYEIGIRLAVGARGREIAALTMRTASQALPWGVAAGFVLSLLAVPVLQHFLYGLSPFDPIAYAQVCGILALATAVATWVPTRRAISVDPVRTLRGD